MCFSTNVSFGAAAILGVTSAVSLTKVTHRKEILFAGIPLLFALQQTTEGFLWMALNDPTYKEWQGPLTYLYLFFAQVLWPAWIPLAVFMLEPFAGRRKIMLVLTYIGLASAGLLAFRLNFFNVSSRAISHHIYYDIESPQFIIIISSALYFICTCVPCFLSSIKQINVLAVLLIVSLIFSRIFYIGFFISVWCFFAAILSVFIIYIMSRIRQQEKLPLVENQPHGATT